MNALSRRGSNLLPALAQYDRGLKRFCKVGISVGNDFKCQRISDKSKLQAHLHKTLGFSLYFDKNPLSQLC